MAIRAANLPAARLKAKLTRSIDNPKMAGPKDTPSAPPSVGQPKAMNFSQPPMKAGPKLKSYKGSKKFLGSFKYGGPVLRTGLYLVHKGEHVKSPFNRRKG